jgi:hypothetical protein
VEQLTQLADGLGKPQPAGANEAPHLGNTNNHRVVASPDIGRRVSRIG